jgi:hypothetical protein
MRGVQHAAAPSIPSRAPRHIGSSAGARHWAALRADSVAGDDGVGSVEHFDQLVGWHTVIMYLIGLYETGGLSALECTP